MAKENSILEEALLEAKQIEDALKSNTKEILATTFRQEIGDLVNESLKGDTNKGNGLRKTKSVNEQEEDEVEDELGDLDIELSDEEGGEEDLEDLIEPVADAGDDVEMPELPEPDTLGEPEGDDEEEIDLTGAEDEDVLQIFKDMTDSDQIVVVKTDDGIEIDDKETGAEYIVKGLDESNNNESLKDLTTEDNEPIYEIVFDESEEELYEDEPGIGESEVELAEDESLLTEKYKTKQDCINAECLNLSTEDQVACIDACDGKVGGAATRPSGGGRPTKTDARPERGGGRSRRSIGEDGEAVEEASRTLGSGKSHGRAGLSKPRAYSKHVGIGPNENVKSNNYNHLVSEVKNLKSKNGEYKEALKVFRNKLNEVAIFNSNLAYATRLFTEHSTTKKEKLTILKRFDEIENLRESKSLYKSICNELNEKQSITESVDRKVNKNLTQGSANLNESTAYVDPQIRDIKSLMSRMSRR